MLELFADAVIYSRVHPKLNFDSGLFGLSIGGIKFAVFIHKEQDGSLKLFNFFGDFYRKAVFCLTNSEDDTTCDNVSPYGLLTAEDISTLKNFDAHVVIESITLTPLNDLTLGYINKLLLEVIKAFDADSTRTDVYRLALSIAEYLEDYDRASGIYTINRLQIIRRERSLNKSEKELLRSLGEKDRDNIAVQAAVSILLENRSDFEHYLDMFSQDEREDFCRFPIYNLAKSWR